MKPPKTPPTAATIRIERVGTEGDGVGHLPDGAPVYVPLTLPDEQVVAQPLRSLGDGWLATAEAIETPSPARVAPPCRHFGACGGCVLQHWRDAEYRNWKAGVVTYALRQAGFDLPDIAETAQDAPDDTASFLPGLPGERRRIDFAVRRAGGRILLGLHGSRSPDIVDLLDCIVLHPTLMALMTPLRSVLNGMQAVKREASVVINLLDSGADMLLRTDAALVQDDRNALTAFARRFDMPRISVGEAGAAPETICLMRPPVTALSGVPVKPPPGAFLQATTEGEAAIIRAVRQGLPSKINNKTRIAELYAGCGTLTFALSGAIRVAAFEGDLATVTALKQAVNQSLLTGRIEATQRDLARQPLSVKELGAFAGVVLDPPHAGAAAQIAQIAAAGVPNVVYVSCNPATLSRDAKVLRAAGYRLESVTAIDQFLWSARIESVSIFRKG